MTIPLKSLAIAGGRFTVPYDSTQGVPGIVFLIFWIIIFIFGIRLAWEYRDKIFPKNISHNNKDSKSNLRKLK